MHFKMLVSSISQPLLPDYWGAANRANESKQTACPEPAMFTVASIDTHLTQPSHKLYRLSEHAEPHQQWGSAVNALHISRDERRQEIRPLKRDLTGKERRGVYVLLALLGSSWLLSGIIERAEKTKERS
jgi:hypothetical protein